MRPVKDWKKQRVINQYNAFEKRVFIFCEGKKTEPNYFEGIKRHIERNIIYKNKILIMIEGVGAETLGVLKHAIEYVQINEISDSDIWIVYDKDSFPAERFNRVCYDVDQLNMNQKKVRYHVAWSNQCIEYWFILHFDYYESDNDRQCYIAYLNSKFKTLGLDKYEKNDPLIFERLFKHGNPLQAVKHAAKRIECFHNATPSDMAPATTVHNLYSRLNIYFPS